VEADAVHNLGESLGSLVESLIRWTGELVPQPARSAELERNLRDWLAGHQPATPVTRSVLADVEAVCHRTARHLTMDLHDEATEPDRVAPGWPAVPRDIVDRRAGFVRRAQRSADGRSGELQLDGFDDLGHAGRFLAAAFTLVAEVDTLILDLRHNGGGDVNALALVAEFVLGTGAEHLATVRYRRRPPRQWWTTGALGDRHLPHDARVAVLIGPGTYSSGGALAYHLQSRDRAHLFGERTPGAGDHVTPVRVTPHVGALIPEGTTIDAVTGTNWEGVGVLPDTPCPAAEALIRARAWA
jgi:C-terminal processing protease CtpA/Prc